MGTLIVGVILVAVVAAIIFTQIKRHKNGAHSCGGNCSGCSVCCPGASGKNNPFRMTVLEIDGMMCPMCESHVNDAIRNNFKVKSVKSSHKTGICTVLSKEPLDCDKLEKIMTETGYKLKKIVNAEDCKIKS